MNEVVEEEDEEVDDDLASPANHRRPLVLNENIGCAADDDNDNDIEVVVIVVVVEQIRVFNEFDRDDEYGGIVVA